MIDATATSAISTIFRMSIFVSSNTVGDGIVCSPFVCLISGVTTAQIFVVVGAPDIGIRVVESVDFGLVVVNFWVVPFGVDASVVWAVVVCGITAVVVGVGVVVGSDMVVDWSAFVIVGVVVSVAMPVMAFRIITRAVDFSFLVVDASSNMVVAGTVGVNFGVATLRGGIPLVVGGCDVGICSILKRFPLL